MEYIFMLTQVESGVNADMHILLWRINHTEYTGRDGGDRQRARPDGVNHRSGHLPQVHIKQMCLICLIFVASLSRQVWYRLTIGRTRIQPHAKDEHIYETHTIFVVNKQNVARWSSNKHTQMLRLCHSTKTHFGSRMLSIYGLLWFFCKFKMQTKQSHIQRRYKEGSCHCAFE